ncbi:hypothetical protein ACFLXE_06960 [Chloroflexota bacterium]
MKREPDLQITVKWRTAQGTPPPSWKRLWDTLLRGTDTVDGSMHSTGDGASRGQPDHAVTEVGQSVPPPQRIADDTETEP